VHWKGISCPSSYAHSLCTVLYGVSHFALPNVPCHDVLSPHINPEAMEPSDHGLKL
jgi:hypothetical protein